MIVIVQTISKGDWKKMGKDVFEFSLEGKKYKVERLKGRVARKNMFKIIGLFSKLVAEAQNNGFSLDNLFSRSDVDGDLEVSVFFDEIVNVVIAIGPLMKDEAFLDEFEGLLPIILGLDDKILDKAGTFIEVYGAAVRAMIFHVGQNMTEEASESLKNFTTPSGQTEEAKEPEIVKETEVK